MLRLWGYTSTSDCPLCPQKKCTLHHIIVNCPFSLNQGRYTWRHDSVLANIEPALKKLINTANSRKPFSRTEAARNALKCSFVRAGNTRPVPKNKPSPGLVSFANDWSLLVDYDHKQITFPPNIYSTNERPDIVIWSRKTQRVILLELTCCAEEGFSAAQLRKQVRYHELVDNINSRGWKADLFTLEVGARGLIANGTFRCFVAIGLSAREATALCRELSVVVARCSYAIYLAHKSEVWSHNSDLVIGAA